MNHPAGAADAPAVHHPNAMAGHPLEVEHATVDGDAVPGGRPIPPNLFCVGGPRRQRTSWLGASGPARAGPPACRRREQLDVGVQVVVLHQPQSTFEDLPGRRHHLPPFGPAGRLGRVISGTPYSGIPLVWLSSIRTVIPRTWACSDTV